MDLKFNPFNPQGLIAPGMFCGRGEEMKIVEQCLFQAKHGNPQHFLIQGERGIGKSSLLLYVEALATQSDEFSFLTVTVDLAGCLTQADIIRAIGLELKRTINVADTLKESAKKFVDWVTNWEILGVRYHKHPEEYDPQDAALQLVGNIADFCASGAAGLDGVLILIDEADRPREEANLGELAKFITERLSRRRCYNVVIGMAALPSIISKLRASHESSPRIFRTMLLEPLLLHERKQVVKAGLKISREKNGFATKIESDALDLISELSEGYPHFIQQFAFSAFEADKNDVIEKSDVFRGAVDALEQLGDKYFNEMYHARTLSEDYRKVLNAMAKHGDQWIARQTIIKESKVKETSVTNALAALKRRGVIIADGTRQGQYRLPTRSFATWINAIRAARPRGSRGDLLEG